MNIIRTARPQWAILVTAAALACVAGCTSSDTNHPAAGPDVHDATQETSAGAAAKPTDSDPGQRRAGRDPAKPQELGALNKPPSAQDVGAPFDPCALSWNAFPPEVRPDPQDTDNHAPRLKKPDLDQWTVECEYDNSGSITVDPNGNNSSGPQGGYLIISVSWAKDGQADPSNAPGSQPKTWDGKPGFELSQPDDPQLGQLCMSSVKLSTGSGVTTVANSRFRNQKSACDIADASAKAIASMSH